MVIGLELYDYAADATDAQRRTDELGRDLVHGAVEK
jgi:hypothetical protein